MPTLFLSSCFIHRISLYSQVQDSHTLSSHRKRQKQQNGQNREGFIVAELPMKCAARTRRHHFVWMEWNGGIHSSTATALQAWCVFCFRGRRSNLLTLHASRVTAGVEQWVKRTRGNIMSSTYIVNVAAGDSKSLCDAIWRLNDLDRVAFPEEGQFQ